MKTQRKSPLRDCSLLMKAALGRFSLREFHTRVLHAGRVPLSVLEQEFDRWLAAKQG